MKKQLTTKKRGKVSALKIPFRDVGKEVDRLVKLRRNKNGDNIKEAYEYISKRHRPLYKRWCSLKGPWVGRAFEDIDFLAQFLNTGGDAEMSRLLEPIVNWETASSGDVEKAAESLAKKMEDLKTTCSAHCVVGKKPFFLWSVVGHPFYRNISICLQTGNFRKLKQCRFCKAFFVSEDHRTFHCPKKRCREEHMKSDAKGGMQIIRSRELQEKVNRAINFIEECRKDVGESILEFLELEGEYAKTIIKIREGIAKKWSAKKILNVISGKGRNYLADLDVSKIKAGVLI